MDSKYTIASRNRWKKVSPLQRSKRMSAIRRKGWSHASVEERKKVGMTLAKARIIKRQND